MSYGRFHIEVCQSERQSSIRQFDNRQKKLKGVFIQCDIKPLLIVKICILVLVFCCVVITLVVILGGMHLGREQGKRTRRPSQRAILANEDRKRSASASPGELLGLLCWMLGSC